MNAQSRLRFGHLFQEDASTAQSEKLQRILGILKLKLGILEGYTSRNDDIEETCFTVSSTREYKVEIFALLEHWCKPEYNVSK